MGIRNGRINSNDTSFTSGLVTCVLYSRGARFYPSIGGRAVAVRRAPVFIQKKLK